MLVVMASLIGRIYVIQTSGILPNRHLSGYNQIHSDYSEVRYHSEVQYGTPTKE